MQDFTYYDPYLVISIFEPGENTPSVKIDYNRKDILPIEIHDIDDVEMAKKHGYKIMDIEQAKSIINFVEKYKDKVSTIVVHCHAGICRSAGCGAALLKIYNYDDSEIMMSDKYIPNKHVYNMVINAAIKLGVFDTDKFMKETKGI